MNNGATAIEHELFCSCTDPVDNIQAFVGTQVNIIDSIVITRELDTSMVLAEWIALDPSISVFSEFNSAQAVKVFINWSDQNGTIDLQQGDFFTVVIPELFSYEFIQNVNDVPITNQAGEVVATYTIFDNANNMKEVIITFTDYVNNHTNISGNFWELLFVASVATTTLKTMDFVINDVLVAQGEVTVNPISGNLTPRDRKIGYSSPTRSAGGFYVFEWIVYVNMGENAVNGFNTLEGFSFEDIIPADSPHIFLSDRIRQELGIPATDFGIEIGEYTGADTYPPNLRYQRFLAQYNSTGASIWYNDIDWNTLSDGLTTVGIDGGEGLHVSNIVVADKIFSANLGNVTRPTALRFYTISTIKITESALGDVEVVGLFKNSFMGSYGEELNASLTLYRFLAGGTAQGISGDFSFSFTKVKANDEGIPGAMYSLFVSQDFTLGANRFVFSDIDGVVSFINLPSGTYYVEETQAPYGFIANSTIYQVILSSQGFDIFYGPNFENRLIDNKIINNSEFDVQPALVILSGRKSLTGILETDMFSFAVKDSNGNIVSTGTNDIQGNIEFSSIEFDTPGVFTFTVEEVIQENSGIIYDGTIFTVTVTVTLVGERLVAVAAYPESGIVFHNNFVTTPVFVTLVGTKNLIGRTLESDMFEFVVRDSEGSIVADGTNNADGLITFSSIEFNAAGMFSFTVEEVMGSIPGIIFDESVFTVIVTITAGTGGMLMAEVSYPSGGIVFNNRILPTPSMKKRRRFRCVPCCLPCCIKDCKPCCNDDIKE